MRYRKKMNRRTSRKNFSRGANRIHKKNMPRRNPMRGGIRL